MSEKRAQLTRSDIEKIEAEIDERKLVTRPQLIKEVQEARAQGDLSENFEYYAAKKAKNENESRIRYLEGMLRTARVISDSSADDEVGINNTVTLYFEEDDEEQVYKVVTSIRGNSLEDRISNESPIGRAIIGHKVGDRVKVTVNDNISYFVTIRNIDKTSTDDDEIKKFYSIRFFSELTMLARRSESMCEAESMRSLILSARPSSLYMDASIR